MNDHARELRRYAPLLGRPTMMLAAADEIERLAAKLEADEKAVAEAYQLGYETGQEEVEKERDALRAKVEAMERQEPVAWMSSRNGFICKENKNPDYNVPLYALPGAKGE